MTKLIIGAFSGAFLVLVILNQFIFLPKSMFTDNTVSFGSNIEVNGKQYVYSFTQMEELP